MVSRSHEPDALKDLGEQGWEMVSVVWHPTFGSRVYLKRPTGRTVDTNDSAPPIESDTP